MSLKNKVLARIKGKGRGSAFSFSDFADLGDRDVLDVALSRLAKQGAIRRVTRGIYDFPRQSRWRGGDAAADLDSVAWAIARGQKIRLQISGAHAANRLGLSTQVPAHRIYLTDGPNRDVTVGNGKIVFRRAVPKRLLGAGTVAGDTFQALRWLGKRGVDDRVLGTLRDNLSDDAKRQLRRDLADMPVWMHPMVSDLTEQRLNP
jgi:hypothetical protein